MAQIDLYSKVTSPLIRFEILTNPSYLDELNECQKIYISDLLNISIKFETLSIIITILTIYANKMCQFFITEQISISLTRDAKA